MSWTERSQWRRWGCNTLPIRVLKPSFPAATRLNLLQHKYIPALQFLIFPGFLLFCPTKLRRLFKEGLRHYIRSGGIFFFRALTKKHSPNGNYLSFYALPLFIRNTGHLWCSRALCLAPALTESLQNSWQHSGPAGLVPTQPAASATREGRAAKHPGRCQPKLTFPPQIEGNASHRDVTLIHDLPQLKATSCELYNARVFRNFWDPGTLSLYISQVYIPWFLPRRDYKGIRMRFVFFRFSIAVLSWILWQ